MSADLHAVARQVLRDNDRGGYTVPTAQLYPFQWNWDSLFVALGWAEFDRDRAWQEIDRLFAAQWPSGKVPHIVFWTDEPTYFPGPDVWRTGRCDPPSSGISQPPVAATVVRRLVEGGDDRTGGDETGGGNTGGGNTGGDNAAERFDAIDRWHQWWHRARDPDGLGIVAIHHPWESGRDNLPDWDRPLAAVDTTAVGHYERRDLDVVDPTMRPHASEYDRYVALVEHGVEQGWDDERLATSNPFRVADPGVTAILLRAERDLAWLGRDLGRDVEEIEERIERMEAGFGRLWNPTARAYCSIDLITGVQAETGTSASFLAPYAGIDAHLEELVDELGVWADVCRYLVPSFDPRDPRFEPVRYWRGPAWGMMNQLIADGLARADEPAWAERLRADTAEMTRVGGMAESWNPLDGAAAGGRHFSWTAAVWLAWAGNDGRVVT